MPRCTVVCRRLSHRVIYSPGAPKMPLHAMGSKNSAYAGASGAHRLAWRPDSVALVCEMRGAATARLSSSRIRRRRSRRSRAARFSAHSSIAIAALGACGALGFRERPVPSAAATPSSPTFRRWQRSISPQLMMRLTTSMKTGWKD